MALIHYCSALLTASLKEPISSTKPFWNASCPTKPALSRSLSTCVLESWRPLLTISKKICHNRAQFLFDKYLALVFANGENADALANSVVETPSECTPIFLNTIFESREHRENTDRACNSVCIGNNIIWRWMNQ